MNTETIVVIVVPVVIGVILALLLATICIRRFRKKYDDKGTVINSTETKPKDGDPKGSLKSLGSEATLS